MKTIRNIRALATALQHQAMLAETWQNVVQIRRCNVSLSVAVYDCRTSRDSYDGNVPGNGKDKERLSEVVESLGQTEKINYSSNFKTRLPPWVYHRTAGEGVHIFQKPGRTLCRCYLPAMVRKYKQREIL